VEKAKAAGAKKRLVSLVLADPGVMAWGSELVLRDGRPVGQVSSAAFGHTVGAVVALAWVANPDGATDAPFLASGRFQVDVAGAHCDARASFKPPYDPGALRVK
jgi:4-methylaminobutanoate oxidase (formaldehyde-forming)